MSKEEADAEEEKGNYVVEEEPGKFRRIIASPMPIDIYEIDAVKALLDADQVVIARAVVEFLYYSKVHILRVQVLLLKRIIQCQVSRTCWSRNITFPYSI